MSEDHQPTLLERQEKWIETVFVWVGFFLFAIPTGMIIYGVYRWLRSGYWPVQNNADLLISWGQPLPYTDWAGIQVVIDWVLNLPSIFGVIGVLMIAVTLIHGVLESTKRKVDAERQANRDAKRGAV